MEAPVASSVPELRALLNQHRARGERIGVVPTMGALHAGHLSLMQSAREQCDFLVTSIFVNPTQFAPKEDFDQYPRPLQKDLELCHSRSVDLVFTPTPDVMYPTDHQTEVNVTNISKLWEGAHRPSHFSGVVTVVLKLLNILQPQIAFFGQKDYQQQLLIRQMCRDLNVPTQIQTCETMREEDGLALSSRNAYLSAEERTEAVKLSSALRLGVESLTAGATNLPEVRNQMRDHLLSETKFRPDYITIVDALTLNELETPHDQMVAIAAARLGETRLIDNLLIPPFSLQQLNGTNLPQ